MTLVATADIFIFIRNGHYDKAGWSLSDRKRQPLSSLGVRQVEEAARWLGKRGVVPDLVIHTNTERTRQTAKIV